MGSCGSSLNCNKCYASKPIDGCDTEIDIDPDIAGIGVLISFLFCAYGLSAVIIWGYYNECLPLDVLSRTDHYALQALKKLRRPFTEADLHFRPTPKHKERTQIIVGFVTVLSDQQLITGVAILIAGLASRCRITFYEFKIVTFLAYFATFTHALSLGVLQSHLFKRKLVRDCRVVFTIGFLVIFAFSFIINTVSSNFDEVNHKTTLNVGNVLQCLFEASQFGKSIQFDLVDSTAVLGLVLIKHTLAIANLYFEPKRSALGVWVLSFYSECLQLKGLSKEDARAILNNGSVKYYAKLDPPAATAEQTKMSIWFFFDRYYESYLSNLPEIVLGMTYGTGSVVLAVWYGGLKPANSLHILGFGQVVAIVLLALTLLAAVEVIDEQKLPDEQVVSCEACSSSQANVTAKSPTKRSNTAEGSNQDENGQGPSRTSVSEPKGLSHRIRKFREDLKAIRSRLSAQNNDNIYTARKMGRYTLFYCFCETCFFAYSGIMWNFSWGSGWPSFFIFFYLTFRFLLMGKSIMDQISFIRDEVRISRNRARPESQLSMLTQARPESYRSDQSMVTSAPSDNTSIQSTSPSPSRPLSVIEQWSTGREHQTDFGPPGRVDTEADIGLVPLARRKTFPPQQNGEDA